MPLSPITPWHATFGLRLRQARTRARYSTRQVAEIIEERYRLHLSHGSLARIERGEQKISVGMLAVLCDIYEVAPGEVAAGSDVGGKDTRGELLAAGLEKRGVDGIVWLEQMLHHGFSRDGIETSLRPGQKDGAR